MSWYDTILYPFKWVLAWITVGINRGLVLIGLPDGSGITWILTIIVLTILVRACIIPLYLRQIRSSRNMAVVQPEMKKIREKYKGKRDQVSQQQMNQELQAVYSNYGVNPLASCFPMLIQLPVLMALYRVLWNAPQIADGSMEALGGFNKELASQMDATTVFGSALSSTWSSGANHALVIVTVVLYAALMFGQQFLNYKWNMNSDPKDQQARMMKSMMYVFPLMSAWFGFIVQMGVLIYLLVTMVFSFAQQLFVIYALPTPNSRAHNMMIERHKKKYETFKSSENEKYQAALQALDLTQEDINGAQRIKIKAVNEARKKNEGEQEIDPFVDVSNGDKLAQGLKLYEEHQATLHKKAQDLELEEKPKKKRKPSAMQKMMDKQLSAANQSRGSGTHDPQAQPKRLTRAQREAQAKRRRAYQETQDKELSATELERRRQERQKQRRAQKKKRRNR